MLNKKKVYLLLVIFLGCLIGDILYDMLEIFYLNSVMAQKDNLYFSYGKSFLILRPLPEMIFVFVGMLVGRYAGSHWWRIIYLEDRRHRHYKIDW